MDLHATSRMLRLVVTDTRPGRPVVRLVDTSSRESGRGMILVQTLARRWGVDRIRRRAGKAVWLELRLNP